jgi:hypothetical protein
VDHEVTLGALLFGSTCRNTWSTAAEGPIKGVVSWVLPASKGSGTREPQ